MKLLNRSAISIVAKQPFIDWVAHLPLDEEMGTVPIDELGQEGNVYLINEVEAEDEFETTLKDNWLTLFENELSAWDEFGDYWPESLSYALFTEWFDVKPQVMCFDIATDQLLTASLEGAD